MSQTSPAMPSSAYEPNQIAVALEHLSLLDDQLNDEVGHRVAKTSDVLGLALVQLDDVEAAAKTLMRSALELGSDYYIPPPTRGPALDQVLWALRRLCAAQYAGWTPTLGKNRFVEHAHGAWVVQHGGDGAPQAHANPTTTPRAMGPGSGIRVGVLDTAFYPQPWLAGGWTARFSDILVPNADPTVADGHATFVTGLILSQAPGATVEVRRVLDGDGKRDSWVVAEEIVRLGQSGLDVMNLSLTSHTDDNEAPMVLATAIDRLDPHLVVVAAAGNYDPPDPTKADSKERNRPSWPAALDDVIAVGAATNDGGLASFSPNAPWVDVLALGEDVVSSYLSERKDPKGNAYAGWATWCGTSFAAALFSGAVAAGAVMNRMSGAESARNILATLRDNKSSFVEDTHAKYLPLRLW